MVDEFLKIIDLVGLRVAISIFLQICRVFSVFLVGLSAVYVVGRELNILKSDRTKNAFCLVVMFCVSFVETWLFYNNTLVMMLWETLLIMLFANIPYVLFGFKLYDRMDNWQDRKFADDEKKKWVHTRDNKRRHK